MWKNLNKATTTTILAILFVLLGFGLLYAIGTGKFKFSDASERTQLITGTFTLLTMVGVAYFQPQRRNEKEKE